MSDEQPTRQLTEAERMHLRLFGREPADGDPLRKPDPPAEPDIFGDVLRRRRVLVNRNTFYADELTAPTEPDDASPTPDNTEETSA